MYLKGKKQGNHLQKYSKSIMKRPIAISLAPNLENSDVLLALRILFSPLLWFGTEYVKILEQWFRQYFTVSYAVSFASGRGALTAVLKSMDIKEKDEVILQAFTCVAVPNAITAIGAKPVYADIDKTFTINVSDIEGKVSEKTKAIVVQHTFGIAANMRKIRTLVKKHNLFLIEDCAHTVGGWYENRKLGTLGDAAIFSFGRDKTFSSVFGGMAITKNDTLGKKIRYFQKLQGNPSIFWTMQQLFHPIAFFFILPLYNTFSLGKILLVVLQKLRFLSFPVMTQEKEGESIPLFMKKLPNTLALFSISQLRRLERFNKKRREISLIYTRAFGNKSYGDIALLRFPLLIEKRDELVGFLQKNGIYVGKWYSEIIDPKGTNLKKIGYQRGSCPNAEKLAQHIVNLPTYPTMTVTDAKKVVAIIKQYGYF